MTSRRAHWDDIYGRKDEDAVGWFQAEPRLSLELIGRTGLPPEAGVIDIGGGASRLVDRLLERGFADITVLDLAEAALARTRGRLGAAAERVRWLVGDVTAWRPGRRYDLWHDRAVFHFLAEAADREAYLEALRAALRPGGHLVVATFAADGPERCSGLPVVRYESDALAATLGAGFSPVETATEEHRTPAGVPQRFQYCRFRRDD